jgi:DNA-directed RNA polymerase beta subunit
VGGKSAHGGQRVGEMEKDVFCGNGVMMMLKNKMFDDSDGRINYYCR